VDLLKILTELHDEKERLDGIIEMLEELESGGSPQRLRSRAARSRRGRKTMGEEERRQVSERMAKYWAERRAARTSDAPPNNPQTSDAA
jgi:hypothetical protein